MGGGRGCRYAAPESVGYFFQSALQTAGLDPQINLCFGAGRQSVHFRGLPQAILGPSGAIGHFPIRRFQELAGDLKGACSIASPNSLCTECTQPERGRTVNMRGRRVHLFVLLTSRNSVMLKRNFKF